ncbi:MAG: PfkB family carbohydrate kinase [Lachnospiraceae bacterium]|nr:PfkB family carbohydrate kinase [Lachnospiraceae bacterium]
MKTLVVGAAMIDMVMVMDKLPKSGEDKLCKEASLEIGGCAYNVSSTLDNLECEFDLCVPVGNGPYGAIIESRLKQKGYKILVKDTQKDNGYCVCMVEENGERTFVTIQGIEGDFQADYFEELDMSQYQNIYVAGYQVCNHSGEVISKWLETLTDKTIYFAPGPVICNITEEVMKRIMSKHPVVHINDKEARDYTGQSTVEACAKKLYEQNRNLVIITTGDKGVIYYDGIEVHEVASGKAKVVDTIGAGDSHAGAFIGGISKGMSTEESLKLANKVAANIVSVYGPVMDKKTFNERMEKDYE